MNLLVLSQDGCRPCTFVKNFLDGQNVKYELVNVQEKRDYIEKYNIMSTPVTVLLDNEGNEVSRTSGFNPEDLGEMIAKL